MPKHPYLIAISAQGFAVLRYDEHFRPTCVVLQGCKIAFRRLERISQPLTSTPVAPRRRTIATLHVRSISGILTMPRLHEILQNHAFELKIVVLVLSNLTTNCAKMGAVVTS